MIPFPGFRDGWSEETFSADIWKDGEYYTIYACPSLEGLIATSMGLMDID